MAAIRVALVLSAIALLPAVPPRTALAACSPSSLDVVQTELRSGDVPTCGLKPVRRTFKRARKKASRVTARAIVQCTSGQIPRVASAHRALLKALAQIGKSSADGALPAACAVAYETELERLDAELTAAVNGTETTTTTTTPPLPGESTTTTLPSCTMITLEVDKSDCAGVTSEPPGLVDCGDGCDVRTFAVPAFGTLQLKGTPGPGDTTVSFSTDCNDDGTVPLGDASPPDCALSCDCSSDF